MGEAQGWRAGSLPVTEDLSARLLRLPLFYDMTLADAAAVAAMVRGFYGDR